MRHAVFAFVPLFLFSLSAHAQEQSCTADADCPEDSYCEFAPTSGDSSNSSMPDCPPDTDCAFPAVPPEETQPTPTSGVCERGGRSCTNDDDCGDDFYCALDQTDAPACPPGEDCAPVVIDPSGACQHEPFTCESTADCPEPTECQAGECVFKFEECETSSECSTGYECIDLGGGSGDVKSGGGEGGSGDPGAAPTVDSAGSTDPAPNEPIGDAPAANGLTSDAGATDAAVASEQSTNVCFPAPQACSSDADCNDGWSCVALDGSPPSWDGLEVACLPPGIVAVMDGYINVDGERFGGTVGEDNGVGQPPTIDPDVTGMGTQGGSEGSAGGCSLSAPRSSGDAGLWLGLFGLSWLALRRRGRGSAPLDVT